jgi:hypothetical protein
MNVQFPPEVDYQGEVRMKGDLDSIYLLTSTMEDTPEMVDSLVQPGSCVRMKNLISRTWNNNGSRFGVKIADDNFRPTIRNQRMTQTPIDNFQNLNLATVDSKIGLTFHVMYCYMGNGTLNSNYLTKKQFAVLVSTLNVCHFYPLHNVLPVDDTFTSQAMRFEYFKFIKMTPKFEGQVKWNEKNTNKVSRVSIDFSSEFGRVFLRFFCIMLRQMGSNIEGVCRPGLGANSVRIRPHHVEMHTIEGLVMEKEEFSRIARQLYMKGGILAQGVGTKELFYLGRENEDFTTQLDNKEEIVAQMEFMFQKIQKKVGTIIDPDTWEEPEGGYRLPLRPFSENILRFYDVGFNFTSDDPNVCLVPNGPVAMYWLRNLLSGSRFEDDDTNNSLTMSLLSLAHSVNDTEMMEAIIHTLTDRRQIFGDISYNVEELQESIRVPPNNGDADYDLAILDFLQDLSVELDGQEGEDGNVTVDQLVAIIYGSRQRPYSLYGTNGKLGNVHSGK